MWNWQHPNWSNFEYNIAHITPSDTDFLQASGYFFGVLEHLNEEEQKNIRIEMLTTEALTTASIEGELLNRESVQVSLQRSFGIQGDFRKIPPAEYGISQMMVAVYRQFADPLSHQVLFDWHTLIMGDRTDIQQKGGYRTHTEPMQIVSGRVYDPTVHFEAPPSAQVRQEMEQFIQWFNATAPNGETPLPALIRAGIAHLYFVSIHPFEDGNGRVARALAEKALSQSLKKPALISLSSIIEKERNAYYQALKNSSYDSEITDWLNYFSGVVLNAQNDSKKRIFFILEKTRFYDRFQGKFNQRQEKVIRRIFAEGIAGFTGGLSARNYVSIAKTSPATATRDLQDLVKKGAFIVKGQSRSTRYYLNIKKVL